MRNQFLISGYRTPSDDLSVQKKIKVPRRFRVKIVTETQLHFSNVNSKIDVRLTCSTLNRFLHSLLGFQTWIADHCLFAISRNERTLMLDFCRCVQSLKLRLSINCNIGSTPAAYCCYLLGGYYCRIALSEAADIEQNCGKRIIFSTAVIHFFL